VNNGTKEEFKKVKHTEQYFLSETLKDYPFSFNIKYNPERKIIGVWYKESEKGSLVFSEIYLPLEGEIRNFFNKLKGSLEEKIEMLHIEKEKWIR